MYTWLQQGTGGSAGTWADQQLRDRGHTRRHRGKVRVQATGQCTVYSGAAAGADMQAIFDYILKMEYNN